MLRGIVDDGCRAASIATKEPKVVDAKIGVTVLPRTDRT